MLKSIYNKFKLNFAAIEWEINFHGWVAGLSKNKANSVKPVETGVELGLSLAII